MELFLHPGFMIAGAALISSPIIIHLINRMRFKRVRWAAMEFLLKSQKRNRRRLIIEQLILLLLRILLVLLVAFLLARFIGSALGNTSQGTMHVVILDDTPSMADRWTEQGESRNAFGLAKDQIRNLAKNAIQANSPQKMKIYLLSSLATRFKLTDKNVNVLAGDGVPGSVLAKLEPYQDEGFTEKQFLSLLERVLDKDELKQYQEQLLNRADVAEPIFDDRLGGQSDQQLNDKLQAQKLSALHVPASEAVRKGLAVLKKTPEGQKTLHLVSDFRETDWAMGSDLEELNAQIAELLKAKINLSLFDTANPSRFQSKNVTSNGNNLAIVDFRAESRMAAEGVSTEFVVTIQNFGTKDERNFPLSVYVEGKKDYRGSMPVENLPAGQKTEHKFPLVFEKKKLTPEFVHVQARINREETGLQMDNVRDLVIEVRKKIPALIVDGAGRAGQNTGGDSFTLEEAIRSTPSFDTETKSIDELDKINLDVYPSIFLLNVPEIKNKETLDKLRDYVANGGSLAYFLGDKAVASFYNKTLHEDYKGLFPVKIAGRYTDAPPPEEKRIRMLDPQPKILFREKNHPLVKEGLQLPEVTPFYRFLMIDRYWPTTPRSEWNPEIEKEKVEEVITLPNRTSIDAYKARAQELGREAHERTQELAAVEGSFDYQKYVPIMSDYRKKIIEALGKEPPLLFNVVVVLDRMLEDPGVKGNPARPSMPELWGQPPMKALQSHLKRLRETLLYGDPLLLARAYGRGRVVACLTPVGPVSKWNDWGNGLAQNSLPVFIKDLQRYLTSESADLNRIVTPNAGIRLEFDEDKVQEKVAYTFQPQPDLEIKRGAGKDDDEMPAAKPDTITMSVKKKKTKDGGEENKRVFKFDGATQPGVYTFEFKKLDTAQPSEFRTYAFNVDTAAESNMKRASKEKLEISPKSTEGENKKDDSANKIKLLSLGDDLTGFKNRNPDASESPWLYLLFLVILVIEQALAVHLSFHLHSNEQAAPARAQPAAA